MTKIEEPVDGPYYNVLTGELGSNGQDKAENSYTLTAKECRSLAAGIVLLVSVGILNRQNPDIVIVDAARVIRAFLKSKHINVSN